MTLKTHLLIFSAGFILCLAIMIPILSQWNKAATPAASDDYPHLRSSPKPMPTADKSASGEPPKSSKRGGWLVSLAPMYTIGLCVYVAYIVYRIVSKKKTNSNEEVAALLKKKRGGKKIPITQQEIHQLEKKLMASEKAVEDILEKARTVMTDVYQKQLDESSLSETTGSSDEELKIIELATTSSANNDSHQDSSSTSEEQVSLHHRMTHHRTKRSVSEDVSSSSSSEVESGIFHAGASRLKSAVTTVSPLPVEKDEEIISTNHDLSDFESDDDDILTNADGDSAVKSQKDTATEENVELKHRNKPLPPPPLVENLHQFDTESKEIYNNLESDQTKTQFLQDKDQLLNTTKEVVGAIGELKDFIKAQKEEKQ